MHHLPGIVVARVLMFWKVEREDLAYLGLQGD